MDDFICDEDEDEDLEEYKKQIHKIFKYNPNKYKNIDEDDLSDMETDFNTLMREEIKR